MTSASDFVMRSFSQSYFPQMDTFPHAPTPFNSRRSSITLTDILEVTDTLRDVPISTADETSLHSTASRHETGNPILDSTMNGTKNETARDASVTPSVVNNQAQTTLFQSSIWSFRGLSETLTASNQGSLDKFSKQWSASCLNGVETKVQRPLEPVATGQPELSLWKAPALKTRLPPGIIPPPPTISNNTSEFKSSSTTLFDYDLFGTASSSVDFSRSPPEISAQSSGDAHYDVDVYSNFSKAALDECVTPLKNAATMPAPSSAASVSLVSPHFAPFTPIQKHQARGDVFESQSVSFYSSSSSRRGSQPATSTPSSSILSLAASSPSVTTDPIERIDHWFNALSATEIQEPAFTLSCPNTSLVSPTRRATEPSVIDVSRRTRSQSIRSKDSTSDSGTSTVQKKAELYKTEMCRSFEETGQCKYGTRCHFAHSAAELRTVQRHPRYKTQVCRTFWEQGTCPYGKRCCFIHNETKKQG